jgi:hypothetical protein
MSIISGTANWVSETDTPKKKTKEPVIKKEPEWDDVKKLKILESLLKKSIALESEVASVYKQWPTSEMSTVSTLISSIKFNIKKIKPVNE